MISGASSTSEYMVCNVDSFKLCSSQDRDWTNSGINWGRKKEYRFFVIGLSGQGDCGDLENQLFSKPRNDSSSQ